MVVTTSNQKPENREKPKNNMEKMQKTLLSWCR